MRNFFDLALFALTVLVFYAVCILIALYNFWVVTWLVGLLLNNPTVAQFLVSGPWNIPDWLMWIIKFIDWVLGLFGG